MLLGSSWTIGQEGAIQEKDHYSAVSEAVVLDLVVRDKKGQLITDLGPGDFRVFENGKAQTIRTARFIDSAARRKGGTPARAGKPVADVVSGPLHLVSLVFDSLNVESRRFAREASDGLLKSELPPDTYIGVFAIDKGLRVVAPFTSDSGKVREAVQLATSGSFEQVRAQSSALREATLKAAAELGGIPVSGAELEQRIQLDSGSESRGDVKRAAELLLPMRIFEGAQAVETELHGQEVTAGLSALVAGQASAQGRKTVLYFSEGLYLPEKLAYLLRNLVSEANRANVTFYAVDARGLISEAQNQAGAAALGRAGSLSRSQVQDSGYSTPSTTASAGLSQAQSETRGNAPVGPDEMRSLETAEDSMRMNVQGTLDELSANTGGFLTANTNDPGGLLKRFVKDLQQYYEIVYLPDADQSDPSYRKIRVEVDRPGATVQTRDGYFPQAPPVPSESETQGVDAPLLAALNRDELPKELPLESRSFHFETRAGESQQVVAAGVPFEALKTTVDETAQRYSAHLTMLARLKNAAGEVVGTFTRDYPIEGPLAELDGIRKSEVVFLRPFEVSPGLYHLEVAAFDHGAGKASAKRQVLVVKQSGPGVQLSSLILVDSVEPLSDVEKMLDSPLKYLDHRVIPHLGSELEPGTGGEISVFCRVYSSPEITSKTDLTIAIFKDGEALFKGTPELTPLAKPSEMAALFSLPAGTLGPGTYQMKAWAQQGDAIAAESTVFTLK